MAKTTDLLYSMFDAANAVANGFDDYTKKQAELSTRTKSYQLKSDIDDKLARIRQSSTSDKWNEEINGFFEKIKGEMSNPESPYYCKNNLQAEQFNALLGQNQVNVAEHVNNMVMQRQREERIVSTQNAKAQIAQECSGQEYIDRCNDLDRLLFEGGDIGPQDYQAQKDLNYMTGYRKMHTDVFDQSFNTALEKGKSKEAFWQDIKDAVPALNATDIKGLSKVFDTAAMDKDLQQQAYQFYNARLSDIQQGNANKLSEINQKMRQGKTQEEKLNIALQGQREMDKMLGLQLSENDRNKYAAYFDYEIKGGANGGRSASSSLKKLDAQDYIDFYLNAIENGDETTVYNAKKNLYDDLREEYTKETGIQNVSDIELEKAYPKIGKFLSEAEKRLPPDFKGIVSYAENVVKSALNTKENKDLYKSEIDSTLDLVMDTLFDADLKNAGPEAKKDLKTRIVRAINANLGGILEKQKDYKEYFDKDYAGIETLSDYRIGVIQGDEARMAQAMKERDDNPDLVYTRSHGLAVPYALKEGLARLENDERNELKALIKNQTGRDVSDEDIDMHYESDGRNDVTARRRYTIDGYDYRFRTEDGKHVILEKKKSGKDPNTQKPYKWETTKTVSQQKEYDSPKAVTKRTETEVESIINKKGWKKMPMPESGFTYTDEDGKQQKITYTDPEGEEKEITSTYWKHLRANEKKRIIMDWMEKEPETAKKWLDMLESK